ncbi:MAG: hypothetical protein JRM72_01525 [Nitrososphaerota archaeon]|nr:hypothetical protein [Nitrososphaerota archaeon]
MSPTSNPHEAPDKHAHRKFVFNSTIVTSNFEKVSGWTTVIKTPSNKIVIQSALFCSCDKLFGCEEDQLRHILNNIWEELFKEQFDMWIDGKPVAKTTEMREAVFTAIQKGIPIQAVAALG